MKTFILVALTICVMGAFSRRLYKNNLQMRSERGIVKRIVEKESYVVFDNRSGRKVKLLFVDLTSKIQEQITFRSIMPDRGMQVDSYNTNKWYAKDDRGNGLLLNGRSAYVPEPNTKLERTVVVITRPGVSPTVFPEIFIETLMVLDYTVLAQLGSTAAARRYGMTLFKLTNDIFQDKTLTKHGFRINVVASEILVLPEDVKINIGPKNGHYNLDIACRFMREYSKKSRKSFDVKVFLTRKGLGLAGGFARKETICSASGCAIVNDHGFTSTFLIAHEIAHTFGLDDQIFPRSNDMRYIISSAVTANFGNFAWSQYSVALFTAYLREYRCLRNKATGNRKLPVLDKYLGAHFSFHEQCALEYGESYTKWIAPRDDPYYRNPCEEMRCSPAKNLFFYKTIGSPPLEGTKCGENKWCVERECQEKTSRAKTVKVVDGNWGRWTSWTACSRSCDAGVRSRQRYCDNPKPLNGGKNCVGLATEIATCGTGRKCPNENIHHQQCAKNGARFDRRWRNKADTKLCKLMCVSRRWPRKNIEVDIPDGQPCYENNMRYICYEGKCVNVGCDGIVESGKALDKCRVCGGNGKSCSKQRVDYEISAGPIAEKAPEVMIKKGLLDCDFKKGFCSWKSQKDGEVQWARAKNTDGHYAYIRAATTSSKGKKKARLVSQEVTAPHACLTFKYRMYGENAFRLKVRLESKVRDTAGSLWSKEGNQGRAWKTAKIGIKNKAPYQIVIEGISNGKGGGSTRIRNIKFSSGRC